MTQKITQRICITGITLFFILIPPVISTVHSAHITPQQSLSIAPLTFEYPDMLIFLSPQYAQDADIQQALTTYQTAINQDINWESTIIPIDENTNTWKTIDHIIESYAAYNTVKACLMIGEDLQTPLAGDTDYMEKPSLLPWSTSEKTTPYELSNYGIVSAPHQITTCIALLYPTHVLSYAIKKAQLIGALQKFCDRYHPLSSKDITVLESSDLNANSQNLYQHLAAYGALHYIENPTNNDIQQSLTSPSSFFVVHGHSNPAGTELNPQEKNAWFSADDVDTVNAPLFAADGCYVNGWWSDHLDNNILDPSIDATWYGSKIFTSTTVHALILGLLSQSGYSYPVNFIDNAVPKIMDGKTLAEAMLQGTYVDSLVIYGDPTFHFTLVTE